MHIVSEERAASLIGDCWTVIPGGFGSCGHPDALTRAIARRFVREGRPRSLSLLFASASGDRQGRGIDVLAQPGLVSRAIGGFWGFVPALGDMVRNETIDAHNWPQGVMSQLFRAIAARQPGVLSRIGLDTFVDPDHGGGRLTSRSREPLVQKISLNGEAMLFYPAAKVDCALLRGTCCDPEGNISMQDEVSYSDALSQAMAAKNSGGIVIAQVERLVGPYEIRPYDVRIPGIFVDYVVVSPPGDHPQTYGDSSDPDFTRAGPAKAGGQAVSAAERIIARRALEEIRRIDGRVANLGIGIPALIGQVANEDGQELSMTLTIESGQIGGTPASGLSFGASRNASALIEQSALFDFYDGGGLDLSCLGFAEVDSHGNVNVSRFDGHLRGAGGFINISQSTRTILFCGTFTAKGLDVDCRNGTLNIVTEGEMHKFVRQVSHLTFSGQHALRCNQTVKLITERAVFGLRGGALHLDEVAPGVCVERDIVAQADGSFIISGNCKLMDRAHLAPPISAVHVA